MAKRRRKSSGSMASKGYPNPVDAHVGNRIRLRRALLGISQTTLLEAIGLSSSKCKNMKGLKPCEFKPVDGYCGGL